jgi:hypothetical protein
MPTTREIIVQQLETRGKNGQMTFDEVYTKLAEYDALIATSKLLPFTPPALVTNRRQGVRICRV